jgi:hypothetical protein
MSIICGAAARACTAGATPLKESAEGATKESCDTREGSTSVGAAQRSMAGEADRRQLADHRRGDRLYAADARAISGSPRTMVLQRN